MEIFKQYRHLGETINDRGNEATTMEKKFHEAAGICAEILAVARMEEMQKMQIQAVIKLAKPC